jgi:hypothetical protein
VVACVGDIVERSVETVSCKQRQAFVTRFKTSRNRGALWRKVKVKVILKRPKNCLDRALWPGLRYQQGRGASASRLRRWHSLHLLADTQDRGDGLRETLPAIGTRFTHTMLTTCIYEPTIVLTSGFRLHQARQSSRCLPSWVHYAGLPQHISIAAMKTVSIQWRDSAFTSRALHGE